MRKIGELLGKAQNALAKEVFVRDGIRRAIKELSGVDVPLEGILLKGRTVVLKKISSAARSEIFIKKPAVLKAIAESKIGLIIADIL